MIWQTLPRPFLMLAPLEGATDTVFRRIVASISRPDIFVTEFTSADGFCSPGKRVVTDNFVFAKEEEPILAQIWGRNPDTLYETTKAVSTMGFAGVDINMGCPDRTVMGKHGCGGAMIDTPEIAQAAITAMKTGVKDAKSVIPVSVKTRIGNKRIETERWITFLLGQGIDALIIHGRTAKELSKVPAHWDEIGKAVAIRDRMKVPTVIVGNGDVKDAAEAMVKHRLYGVDGVMIGRGIFQNLWAFDRSPSPHVATPKELLDVMERHIKLFTQVWGEKKNSAVLKKFYKMYVNGFHGATDWRVRCMEANNAEEVLAICKELKSSKIL